MRRIQKFWKEQSTFHGKEVEKKDKGKLKKVEMKKLRMSKLRIFDRH